MQVVNTTRLFPALIAPKIFFVFKNSHHHHFDPVVREKGFETGHFHTAINTPRLEFVISIFYLNSNNIRNLLSSSYPPLQKDIFSITIKKLFMKSNSFLSCAFCVCALLLLATSCKKEVKDQSSQDNLLTALAGASNPGKLETDLLKSVRNATARFHSTTQAINVGYEPSDHCVSVPNIGGMG